MKNSVDEFASVLEHLTEKVQELERRLSAIEHRAQAANSLLRTPVSPAPVGSAHPLEQASQAPTAAAMPAVGKVFLGIAGAYLLRAVAESALLPRLAVVAVALAYAGLWLVWSARTALGARFPRIAYALTSALILSPMLWEVTLRFRVLPGAATAGVLAAFAVLASAMAWKRNLLSVVWVATFSAATTALLLLVATRNPAPFAGSLLVIALVSEGAACRDRWLSLRPAVAISGDLALAALISIYTRQGGPPAEYQPIAQGALLALLTAWFAIYAAAVIFRTWGDRRDIAFFEIGQTSVAFLLAAVGILRISPTHGAYAVGAFCLLAAAACYWAVSRRFKSITRRRNYHVLATWAAALFLAGSFLVFPEKLRETWLAASALVAVFVGGRSARLTIGFHGAVYLAAAAFASGLLDSAGHVLTGDLPMAANGALWFTAAASLGGYAIATRAFFHPDPWSQRLLRLILAALAAYVVTAVGVLLIVSLTSLAIAVGDRVLAVIRTLAVCLAALALAFAGSRWRRIELVWLAYAAIAFCTFKLLFEDVRIGGAGSIAASLFCYGMAWLLVPRLTRKNAARAETRMA